MNNFIFTVINMLQQEKMFEEAIMKSKYLIILILLSITQLSFGLNCKYRGYLKENNKVYYFGDNSIVKKEVENADFETFEVIKSVNYSLLGKDKDNVYYKGELLEDVDSKTFRIIKEVKPPFKVFLGYGCGSSGYIIEDKGRQHELKEKF